MLKNTGLKIASIKAAQTALLAVATVLAGCSTTGSLPPAPVSASQADYSYVVGAGDNLNIIVWRNPELSLTVPVRPDGKIAAPLIGRASCRERV